MTGDWGGRVLAVRVNDVSTPWAHRDVIDVVSAAGRLDAIVLPRVTSPDHVVWLDLLLGQVEREAGLTPGRTGIEAQIEDAAGLDAVNAIAAASPRLEALVFGPADFMASVGHCRGVRGRHRRTGPRRGHVRRRDDRRGLAQDGPDDHRQDDPGRDAGIESENT